VPINIPNLDDRNYDQLYSEAMSVITRYYPDYAGIGPSDPAMALVELFCYYFDVTSYQINQITQQTLRNFAALMGVQGGNERPEELIRTALAEFSSVARAVTAADIETIVKREAEKAVRVGVFPGERVKVRVVTKNNAPISDADLRRIYSLLRGCSPLGTRFDVRNAPMYGFDIMAEIVKHRETTIKDSDLSGAVQKQLSDFFSPLKGGDGGGWEFGRAISRSEIFGLIEGVEGVDHAASLKIRRSSQAYAGDDELLLKQDELAELNQIEVTIL